jgi:hypothetical protein
LKVKIYKTIILPVVLYGCETWSLTLREEHRRRVFENRVLRGMFGPTRDEVTGEWRKLHNGEVGIFYSFCTQNNAKHYVVPLTPVLIFLQRLTSQQWVKTKGIRKWPLYYIDLTKPPQSQTKQKNKQAMENCQLKIAAHKTSTDNENY